MKRLRLMAMKASCRQVFKKVFGVNCDDDFIGKETADPADVLAFEAYGFPEPEANNLLFDFRNGPRTPWNNAVVDILVTLLAKTSSVSKPEAYLAELVEERYGRVRASWMTGQPRTTDQGVSESPAAMENRMVRAKDAQLKNARRRERRKSVS
jgi:hypothetical protein